jgi:hypothetical protein
MFRFCQSCGTAHDVEMKAVVFMLFKFPMTNRVDPAKREALGMRVFCGIAWGY